MTIQEASHSSFVRPGSRLKAGDKPPLFTHPLRIFDKDAGMEEKDKAKAEAFSLDEQRILEIVDKRVEQKLEDLKLK